MSKSPATKTGTDVGELYAPSIDIDSDDIVLPRIKIADKSHDVVGEGVVPVGSLFATSGQDDPDPVLLSAAGQDAEGIVVHVLGLKKGKSKIVDDELQRWDFGDPDAPADADTTFDFTFALPEVDPDVPYRMLLKRTSVPAAKNIISTIAKNRGLSADHAVAFRIKTKKRETTQYKWHIATARREEAKPENVAIAANLAQLVANRPDLDAAPEQPTNQPAI